MFFLFGSLVSDFGETKTADYTIDGWWLFQGVLTLTCIWIMGFQSARDIYKDEN